MYVQKQKELQKQYDKQEKKLKELKAGGKSTKQAVSMAVPFLTLSQLTHLKRAYKVLMSLADVQNKTLDSSLAMVCATRCHSQWTPMLHLSILSYVDFAADTSF